MQGRSPQLRARQARPRVFPAPSGSRGTSLALQGRNSRAGHAKGSQTGKAPGGNALLLRKRVRLQRGRCSPTARVEVVPDRGRGPD